MSESPFPPPHPALAVASDPALFVVRQVAAGLTDGLSGTGAITGRSGCAPRRGWLARRAAARRCAGLSMNDLADLDMEGVAGWFTAHYAPPVICAVYPGVVIGSTNSAMAQLCSRIRMPWLPQTVLLPLRWEAGCWSSLSAAAALGMQAASAFYGRNPGVALHQSHDVGAGASLALRMWAKLRRLPRAYASFLDTSLAPSAPVILLHDESVWPTTRLGERHVLQIGSRRTRAVPVWTDMVVVVPDGLSPDAEGGFDPDLISDVARWCVVRGRPLYQVRIPDPQALCTAAAEVQRQWNARPVTGVLDTLRVLGGRAEVTVNRCRFYRDTDGF